MALYELINEMNKVYNPEDNSMHFTKDRVPYFMGNVIYALAGPDGFVLEALRPGNTDDLPLTVSGNSFSFTGFFVRDGIPVFQVGFTVHASKNVKVECAVFMTNVCIGQRLGYLWRLDFTPLFIDNQVNRVPCIMEMARVIECVMEYRPGMDGIGWFMVKIALDLSGCEYIMPFLQYGLLLFDASGIMVLNPEQAMLKFVEVPYHLPIQATVFLDKNKEPIPVIGEGVIFEIGVPDPQNPHNYVLEEGEPPQRLTKVFRAFVFEVESLEYYLERPWPVGESEALAEDFYSTGRPYLSCLLLSPMTIVDIVFCKFMCLDPGKLTATVVQYLNKNNLFQATGPCFYTPFLHISSVHHTENGVVVYEMIDMDLTLELYNLSFILSSAKYAEVFLQVFFDHNYIYYRDDDSEFMIAATVSVSDGGFFSPETEEELPIVPVDGKVHMELDTYSGQFYAMTSEAFPAPYALEDSFYMEDFSEHFAELIEADTRDAKDGGLKLNSFEAQGNLMEHTLYVSLSLDTQQVLHYWIGNFEVTVKEISGYLNYNPHNTGLGVSGILSMGFSTKFEIELGAQYEDGLWCFQARLVRGQIPLTEILNRILGWEAGGLELSIDQISIWYRTDRAYALALGISTKLPVFDGTMEISVEGELERRDTARPPSAMLRGVVEIQDFLFEASIRLKDGGQNELSLSVQLGDALLTAFYADQAVTVQVRDLTIGVLLKLLFKVWRPNTKFYLPKPWDILNRVGFPSVTLHYHTVTKEVSVTVAVNIDLLLVRIKGVRFSYERPSPDEEPKFMVDLDHEWLTYPVALTEGNRWEVRNRDNTPDPIKPWDVLNGDSPSPLSEVADKLFRIEYFGIGRYINLNLDEMEDGKLTAILDQAKKNVEPQKGLPADRYSTAYNWFIGAKFTVLDCFDVALLFYEPVIYGLSVNVTKNEPLPLKGLQLTIYYRRITDQIGLFYVNASLPDCIRQMRFGTLSFSLPDIEVWLYTNGNFKINFGFPYNNDFSNCFSLNYGVFTGRGGFYFGYLNGDTSSQVPQTDRGIFDPVIEMGIGFNAQVGTSLNAGVLKLTARLEMTAVFTGVFAKFSYYLPDGQEQTQWYYKCTGMVAVAGEISGEVNFFVIRISFRLYVRVALCLTMEDGEEGKLLLEAILKVSASIKILFIEIKFSFSFEFKSEYILGVWEPRPWKGDMPEIRKNVYVSRLSNGSFDKEPFEVMVSVTPYFSKDGIDIVWEGAAGEKNMDEEIPGGREKVAFLFTVEEESFVKLCCLLTERVIRFINLEERIRVTYEEMKQLRNDLESGAFEDGFTYEAIDAFFSGTLSFRLETAIGLEEGTQLTGVPIPMPPVYEVVWTSPEGDRRAVCGEQCRNFFTQFVLLSTRIGVEKTVSIAEGAGEEGMLIQELLDQMTLTAGPDLCGMVSRFMLGGARYGNNPLYEVILQQFDGVPAGGRDADEVVHTLELVKYVEAAWVENHEFRLAIRGSDLDYPEEPVSFRFLNPPKEIPFYRRVERVAALYDRQEVYGGEEAVYSLWKSPVDLAFLDKLLIEFWEDERINGGILAKSDELSHPAVLLEVTLTRPDRERRLYQIQSAPPQTIEAAMGITEEEVEEITVLFSRPVRQSGDQRPQGTFFYEEDLNSHVCLIRRNLSEETTIPQKEKTDVEAMDDCVLLSANTRRFLKLLGEMLAIGGAGHYVVIDYQLDELLFDNEGELTLFLLVVLKGTAHANRIVLYQAPGLGKTPVIVNPELGTHVISTLGPGHTGFEFTAEGEKEGIRPFHLLYYRLFSELSNPISIQEGENPSDGLHYGITAKLPPLGGSNGSPYERILPDGYERGKTTDINKLDLELFLADLTGNTTYQKNCLKVETLPILYYDNLCAITEIPFTSIGYGMEKHGDKFSCLVYLRPLMREESEEGVNRLTMMRYQIAQEDVRILLRFGIGDTFYEAYLEDEQKEALLLYLEELYQYLITGWRMPVPCTLSADFNFMPEEAEALYVVRLGVWITIERDIHYINPTTELENVGYVKSEIYLGMDPVDFCTVFESVFRNARLVEGEGFYAVIFPRDALCVSPIDKKNAFYSIRPLSTKRFSQSEIQVENLDGEEKKEDYFDIDLEQWAAEFFAFYERLLGQEFLDRILSGEERNENAGVLNQLLNLKRALASRIVDRAQSVFEAVPAPKSAAICIQEALLKNLSDGYRASGAVVYKAEGKLGGYHLAGELSGVNGVTGCKAGAGGHVSFLAAPLVMGLRSNISMEGAVWTFTHLEDVAAGSWYSFVRPFEQIDGYVNVNITRYDDQSPVRIPILYRRYPREPALLTQEARGGGESLKDRDWTYCYRMRAAFVAQDKLYVDIIRNGSGDFYRRGRQSARTLFECLAQFIYNQKEYERRLSKEEESCSGLLKSFLRTAEGVYETWGMDLRSGAGGGACVLHAEFGEQFMEKLWMETSGFASSLRPRLSVMDSEGNQVEDIIASEEGYYAIPNTIKIEPGEEAVYGFSYEKLELYEIQGLRVSVILRQNEELLGLRVNESFIYETQQIGFEKTACPYLSISDGEIRKWSEIEAYAILSGFLAGSGIETELTAFIGRRVAGPGSIAYRPFKRRTKHTMTGSSLRTFVDEIGGYLRDIKAQQVSGRYYVKISLKQFQKRIEGDTDGVVLLEFAGAVFQV